MNGFLPLASSLKTRAQDMFDHSESNVSALGIYAALSSLIWGAVLIWIIPQRYENPGFRVAIAALALPLIFYRSIPADFRKPFPYYFIFYTLVACPFFIFFMTMKNEWSEVWTTTALGGLIVIILVTLDWLFIVVLMSVSFVAALLTVMLLDGEVRYTDFDWTYLLSSVFTLYGVMVAVRWMHSYQELRFTIMKSLSGTIAHEMRNALNSVALSIESVRGLLPLKPVELSDGPEDTAISNVSLASIHHNIDVGSETIHRANKIIDSILLSLNGRMIDQSQFRRLTVSTSIRNALEGYVFSGEEEASFVHVDYSGDFDFFGDQDLFSNLMANLLKNALYYGCIDGFRVDITMQVAEACNRIIIRDTGPGIPADRLEKVFQPFNTYGKPGGTGIGLAFCRRIVASFLGRITCCSVPGEWTEFVIELPAYDSKPVELLKQEILGRKKVLIVDDQMPNRILLSKYFGEMKCICDQAENGLIALQMARNNRYDLILMDIEMPELNGDEAVRRIRHGIGIERFLVQHYLTVPIVGVTALSEEEGLARSSASGMDECLFKPVRRQDIRIMVEKYFFSERRFVANFQPEVKLEGNILVVEDNMVSREFLKAMLEPLGFTVFLAENGRRALDKLESVPVDLVIMDMQMPVMDGIEATKIIRAGGPGKCLEHYCQVPIIMLSGYSDREAISVAMDTEINMHLGKPVRKQELVKAISDLMYNSKAKCQHECNCDLTAPAPWKEFDGVEILDRSTIESLRELGDDEFMGNLFRLFIEDTGKIIDDLDDACMKHDQERAIRANHTLKGSAANIGAARILAVSVRISEFFHQGGCPLSDGWTDYLRCVCRLTSEELSSLTVSKSVSDTASSP